MMRKGLVVALLLGMAVIAAGCGREDDVKEAAKQGVLDNLKAPSTASFCSDPQITENVSDEFFTVEGCVDAENGFGAKIRASYSVEVSYENGKADAYRVNIDSGDDAEE